LSIAIPGQHKQIQSLNEVFSGTEHLLRALGHRLSRNALLFARICRLFRAIVEEKVPQSGLQKAKVASLDRGTLKQNDELKPSTVTSSAPDETEQASESDEIRSIFSLITEVMLPALTCMDGNPNPSAAALLWAVIAVFPFQKRFALYEKVILPCH
jgi:hypothetical protein